MPLPINFNAVLSELLAQFLFVFICASAASAPIASIAARGSRARARGGGTLPPAAPGAPRPGRAAPGAGRPGLAPSPNAPRARGNRLSGRQYITTRTTQARAAPRASPARRAGSSRCRSRSA